MQHTRKKLFVPAVIAAALTIGSLAGCSSGSGSDTSSPSASESASSQSLPSSFPKSDVPIIDGTILVARGDKDNGWSVTVQPTTKTGFADAKAALEKAGYKASGTATDTKALYVNDKYTVAVGTPGVSVTYLVTAN
ncbi:hypothetical protein [Leifsonia poae]|uniref:PASTA domain-containing protein n=1 Tax=Leifsonia poae TaxID=110933 RepID=A0A9W6LZ77_9MICO|nr:hypothetical protein [Leifsonia poae]GLJ75958.1 hypothetical protein GCM10017584_15320 [Leifsonia poae]